MNTVALKHVHTLYTVLACILDPLLLYQLTTGSGSPWTVVRNSAGNFSLTTMLWGRVTNDGASPWNADVALSAESKQFIGLWIDDLEDNYSTSLVI